MADPQISPVAGEAFRVMYVEARARAVELEAEVARLKFVIDSLTAYTTASAPAAWRGSPIHKVGCAYWGQHGEPDVTCTCGADNA